MRQLDSPEALQEYRAGINSSIGLVPTMGALHAGHLTLIEASKANNERTIVSIFVNPTQFNQSNDLAQYPNTLAQDIASLEELAVDAVFLPTFETMYPDGYSYQVTEKDLSQQYCGAHRPGHFDGVLSVVMKLLNLVQADHAYFGEKDYQQLSLIKGMVAAFFIPTKIIPCAIVRETDGLAMSSRNIRLTPIQRKIAPMLYQILSDDSSLTEKREQLETLGFDVDYLSILDNRLLAAATLGDIRLIDNTEYHSAMGVGS
ncbi:MAG: pantoate--beta-alanine ligase [Marinicella sp.]